MSSSSGLGFMLTSLKMNHLRWTLPCAKFPLDYGASSLVPLVRVHNASEKVQVWENIQYLCTCLCHQLFWISHRLFAFITPILRLLNKQIEILVIFYLVHFIVFYYSICFKDDWAIILEKVLKISWNKPHSEHELVALDLCCNQ